MSPNNLARNLHKVFPPERRTPAATEPYIKAWWGAAMCEKTIQTLEFKTTWMDFASAWRNIDEKQWRDPLDEAREAASQQAFPAGKLLAAMKAMPVGCVGETLSSYNGVAGQRTCKSPN
jgi:hypothetical protein